MLIAHDEGQRVLRLNAKGIAIVIPNCKKGQTITVHYKSTSKAAKNYLQAEANVEVLQGFTTPDDGALIQECIGKVKADGDVVFTTTNGLFLFDIILKDATGKPIPAGITNHKLQQKKAQVSMTYNLQGQRVGKSFKGIVIQNGKKIIQK